MYFCSEPSQSQRHESQSRESQRPEPDCKPYKYKILVGFILFMWSFLPLVVYLYTKKQNSLSPSPIDGARVHHYYIEQFMQCTVGRVILSYQDDNMSKRPCVVVDYAVKRCPSSQNDQDYLLLPILMAEMPINKTVEAGLLGYDCYINNFKPYMYGTKEFFILLGYMTFVVSFTMLFIGFYFHCKNEDRYELEDQRIQVEVPRIAVVIQ